MSDFLTLSLSYFSSLSLWFFGLLSPLLKPKTPFFSNSKPRVVVVAAEVGVGPPIRCHLPCGGGVGCVAVVAKWVWVGGLWWQSGFVVWVDL